MGPKLLVAGFGLTLVLMMVQLVVQVDLTELRLQLPKTKQDLYAVLEENSQLQMAIDQLENPARLLQILNQPQYAHLKYPLVEEVLTIVAPNESA